MKIRGVQVDLHDNTGLSFPSNLDELKDEPMLDLTRCSLVGARALARAARAAGL